MFCNTLIAQVLLEDDPATLSFDFTFFRVVKETVVYAETHFKKFNSCLEKENEKDKKCNQCFPVSTADQAFVRLLYPICPALSDS